MNFALDRWWKVIKNILDLVFSNKGELLDGFDRYFEQTCQNTFYWEIDHKFS